MVRTQCFHCWGLGSAPGGGTKILQAVWHRQKKKERIKVNRETETGRKYVQTHIQQKTSICYKQLSRVKPIQLQKTWRDISIKRIINMVKRHTKRCSLWLAIKEMQQAKTMKDYMPTEMIIKCRWGYKETGSFRHWRWECKIRPLWKHTLEHLS